MRMKIMIMLAALAMVFAVGAKAEEATPAVSPKDGVIKLFDGKSLDGFYTWMEDTKYEDPRRVFRVTDGMLHITGDGWGGILTKKQYHSYHLVLEFRWGERTWQDRKDRARDSGLLIHSVGIDGGFQGKWMPAIEVQIIEGGVGDFLLVGGNYGDGNAVPISLTCQSNRDRDGEVIWDEGGKRETFNREYARRINWYGRDPDWRDVKGFRGQDDVESPTGRWTRMDVICDGGRVTVYVNGTKVNEGFDSFPTQGRIQIQAELAELFIRRLELWPVRFNLTPIEPLE